MFQMFHKKDVKITQVAEIKHHLILLSLSTNIDAWKL